MESRGESPLACSRVGECSLPAGCCASRGSLIGGGGFAEDEEFDEGEEDEAED